MGSYLNLSWSFPENDNHPHYTQIKHKYYQRYPIYRYVIDVY